MTAAPPPFRALLRTCLAPLRGRVALLLESSEEMRWLWQGDLGAGGGEVRS